MKKLTEGMLIGAMMLGTFTNAVSAATNTTTHSISALLKSMDSNQDNRVSKAEYLAYSEKAFNKMKLTNGMISLENNANSGYQYLDEDSSRNVRKIGITADNPTVYVWDVAYIKTY